MRRNILWAGITAVVLSLGLAAPLAAGPFEDGMAASGRGDYATAMRLWRPLADQGRAPAQHNLGFMYEIGQGVPQDYAAAAGWYRRAADQGHAPAQGNLGFFYETGRSGLTKDDREAARLFKLAADQGYANAQEAARLFKLAADQGNAYAQVNLGLMYLNGQGVSQDHATAASWFQKAADQGYVPAQGNLGLMYVNGWGVPQDYVAAHMWFNLAAAGGLKDAPTNRDLVAAKMTPEQIAEAEKRFAEWRRGGLTASRVTELETPGLEKRAALPASPQPTESARPKPIVIAGDNGGSLRDYFERYSTQVAAGATFRIDGRCRSACALVLHWADRVCVTERAALGFHQVRDKSGQRVQSLSDLLMSVYPAPVREYILAHGGLPPPWGTMWVSGPALRGLVKPCE